MKKLIIQFIITYKLNLFFKNMNLNPKFYKLKQVLKLKLINKFYVFNEIKVECDENFYGGYEKAYFPYSKKYFQKMELILINAINNSIVSLDKKLLLELLKTQKLGV